MKRPVMTNRARLIAWTKAEAARLGHRGEVQSRVMSDGRVVFWAGGRVVIARVSAGERDCRDVRIEVWSPSQDPEGDVPAYLALGRRVEDMGAAGTVVGLLFRDPE